jgi:predicted aspartyl protease
MAIKEPCVKSENIEVDGQLNGRRVKLIFDTGSIHNYINDSLARNMKVELHDLKESKAEMANGNLIIINKAMKVNLNIQADSTITYGVDLRILPNLTTDIILGMDFMLENEVIINLAERILTVGNKHFEILDDRK